MVDWKTASDFERIQFQVISSFLSHRPNLVQYLFHKERAALNNAPAKLLAGVRGLCRSDKVLVRVAIQLWCEHGEICIAELFCLDSEVFLEVLRAIEALGPKPYYQFQNLLASK